MKVQVAVWGKDVQCGPRSKSANYDLKDSSSWTVSWNMKSSGNRALTRKAVVVGRAHVTGEQGIGCGGAVAGENFLFRIPLQFAAGSQRDDDQVPDAGGTMTGFNIGNWIVPRTH